MSRRTTALEREAATVALRDMVASLEEGGALAAWVFSSLDGCEDRAVAVRHMVSRHARKYGHPVPRQATRIVSRAAALVKQWGPR